MGVWGAKTIGVRVHEQTCACANLFLKKVLTAFFLVTQECTLRMHNLGHVLGERMDFFTRHSWVSRERNVPYGIISSLSFVILFSHALLLKLETHLYKGGAVMGGREGGALPFLLQ